VLILGFYFSLSFATLVAVVLWFTRDNAPGWPDVPEDTACRVQPSEPWPTDDEGQMRRRIPIIKAQQQFILCGCETCCAARDSIAAMKARDILGVCRRDALAAAMTSEDDLEERRR